MGLIDALLRLVRRPAALQVAMLCVRQGPDGFVYLLTDARDGRLLRLQPAASR